MADVTGTATPKKKEIYKYTAPWSVYAMNWSLRPDKKFRLALGSFIEDYSNKVGRIARTHVLVPHLTHSDSPLLLPVYKLVLG